MTGFYAETMAIAAVLIAGITAAYLRTRDPLHPMLVIGAMMLFLYVAMPLHLADQSGFFGFLTEEHLAFVQAVNLAGVLACTIGILVGGGRAAFGARRIAPPPHGRELAKVAIALGVLGLAGFLAGIVEVGGFTAAYGRGYGGGWSDSGYARELYHLTIPAILLLLTSGETARRRSAWIWIALFALPLGIHGLLGARRGPTFIVLVTVLAGRYLVRDERPPLWTVLGGGAVLGVLLLFLVSNRGQIYVGSEFDFEGGPADYIGSSSSNEFIYGAGTIVSTDRAQSFAWGGRYATVFFIRPIPRVLWPTKYEVAARWFGVDVQRNLGIDLDTITNVLGWRGAFGAAPGIIADMWFEFSWGSVVALFLLGLAYGRAWSRSVSAGGLATVVYGALLCLSLYLVMQTLEAMAFRFLLMAVPSWIAWRFAESARRRQVALA